MELLEFHSYFNAVGESPSKIIEKAENKLCGVQFDTMVGIGLSGSLIIPTLARAFNCHWLILRKEHSEHSSKPFGKLGNRWIFVDDFISTGKTFRIVHETITSLTHEKNWYTGALEVTHHTEFIGALLYQDRFSSKEEVDYIPAVALMSQYFKEK